eukprot:GEMP01030330.1.p1 GENE.GEMP01030330.1~~GEMP01030330.1.p1  ORF type:complete len:262 (+),score=45.83 GEMP01030330.1:115-900(+)
MVHEVTSTIDWCEDNWVYHDNVAEWWNTMTALAQVMLGLYGVHRIHVTNNAGRHPREHRGFQILFFNLFVVGIGTMCFHGSLTYSGQMMDEIWMMVMIAMCPHLLLFRRSPLTCCVLWTTVACCSLVHLKFGFVSLFQFGYASCCALTALFGFSEYLKIESSLSAEKKANIQKILWKSLVLCSVGVTSWQTEEFFCNSYKHIANPQLHALWHLFTAWGLFGFGVAMQLMLLSEEAIAPYWMGVPVYTLKDSADFASKTKGA